MKYCEKCGKELYEDAVMCPSCGFRCAGAKLMETDNNRISGACTLGTWSMILGFVSLLLGPLSIVAIILAFSSKRKNNGLMCVQAKTGMILGIVCLCLTVLSVVLYLLGVNFAVLRYLITEFVSKHR